jgi:hypothetical protein
MVERPREAALATFESALREAVHVLRAAGDHGPLVASLGALMESLGTAEPAAWAIRWRDGEDDRRHAFMTRKQALSWLEDRRAFNPELETAQIYPLFGTPHPGSPAPVVREPDAADVQANPRFSRRYAQHG